MKEQIKERIKAWKRFYACQTTDVDENSSWVDILLKLNLSFTESIMLGKQAINECLPFDYEESLYLRQLPYYKEVQELLASLPNQNFGDCFASAPFGDNIYFVRYPKLSDVQPDDNLWQVPIVAATIVYHRPVEFDEDIYTWCNLNSAVGWTCKHLVIRYATEKPTDFFLPKVNKEDIQDVPF
ncbi:MAG: hypothetical protein IJ770_00340 [Alphaproteobacteria bacterium]|nr:hypothetical protein [Alphaproteobacteria bacterium]